MMKVAGRVTKAACDEERFMRRRVKGVWVGGMLMVAAGALAAADRPQPMIGERAPAFSLESLEAKRVSLADFRGKYVVLHFGAGW
jgi:hypothetical protein